MKKRLYLNRFAGALISILQNNKEYFVWSLCINIDNTAELMFDIMPYTFNPGDLFDICISDAENEHSKKRVYLYDCKMEEKTIRNGTILHLTFAHRELKNE